MEILETATVVDTVALGAHQFSERVERRLVVVEDQHILANIHQLQIQIKNTQIKNKIFKKILPFSYEKK